MPYRLLALVAASVLTMSDFALAQKKDPTTDALNLNSSRSNNYKGSATSGAGAGKTNNTLRMGGGGGGRTMGTERRGGGGGGRGAGGMMLNPQPEPPGSKAK